jgi:hypothetical protein
MNRRDDVLTSIKKSTWEEAGRSLTYIVLDELGNAFRLMDRDTSNQCRIWVEGLVSEGRKFGFNIVISNQRATGMASILSQTGKAIFRVETDEERAHRSLAGASTLHDGYFLAKFGMPKLAGGFEPTDEQIQQFLASRPVDKLDDENSWIDAISTDVPSLPDAKPDQISAPSQAQPEKPADEFARWVMSLTDKPSRIVELYQAGGFSQADIEESVYGYRGGAAARAVSSVIKKYRELKNIPTTTTTTTEIRPEISPSLA